MTEHGPQTPTDVVRQRVKDVRKRRGLSGRALAERCQELDRDTTINQSVLANIEAGRRKYVSMDELVLLAYALDVAPVHLVTHPPGDVDPDSYIGSEVIAGWEARRWWIGQGAEVAGDPVSYRHEQDHHDYSQTAYEREMDRRIGAVVEALADLGQLTVEALDAGYRVVGPALELLEAAAATSDAPDSSTEMLAHLQDELDFMERKAGEHANGVQRLTQEVLGLQAHRGRTTHPDEEG